jgi:methionyl-tRNA formyltransferase
MKKENKIIFFGTPDFAVTSLDALSSNFDIHSVVTSPDRKSGRGQKLNESDIKNMRKSIISIFFNPLI